MKVPLRAAIAGEYTVLLAWDKRKRAYTVEFYFNSKLLELFVTRTYNSAVARYKNLVEMIAGFHDHVIEQLYKTIFSI